MKWDSGLWRRCVGLGLCRGLAVFGLPAVLVAISVCQACAAENDYNGDGYSDLAVYRSEYGYWFVYTGRGGAPPHMDAIPGVQHGYYKQWGLDGDIPAPGDYGTVGKTDLAVYRPSNNTWYLKCYNGSTFNINFGATSVQPCPGHFVGDSLADLAYFDNFTRRVRIRPSNNPQNIWQSSILTAPANGYILAMPPGPWGYGGSGNNYEVVNVDLGNNRLEWRGGINFLATNSLATDIPVAGDFDDDGHFDCAYWRSSNGRWYIDHLTTYGNPFNVQWGLPGDIPLSGDYDGDGITDFCVWRAGTPTGYATWYIKTSSGANPGGMTAFPGSNDAYYLQWGFDDDTPLGQTPPQE